MADGEKKGRGRPGKKAPVEAESKKEEEVKEPTEPKKRGRQSAVEKSPEKPISVDEEDENEQEKNGDESPPKKARGRQAATPKAAAPPPKAAVKKGRGRPPKKSAA